MADKKTPPYHSYNPGPSQRYEMVKYLLETSDRPDDLDNLRELLSPPPDILTLCPKGYGKNVRVGIIGGGDAGLSAAFELRRIGCDITLFEASNRIGGRIYTHYFDREKNYFGDIGAMRISPSHEATWHYIDLLGLKTYPFASKNMESRFFIRGGYALNDATGENVMKNIYPRFNLTPEERSTPWFELSGRVINKYLTSIPASLRRELLETKPVYSDYIRVVDNLSYKQAYETVGLSQNAISMLGYLSQFEAIFFSLALTEVLQEAYSVDFNYNYSIEKGMINLPYALYKALIEKNNPYKDVSKDELGRVAIKTSSVVEGIYSYKNSKTITLCIRDDRTNCCSYEDFDFVVCAIPFASLRRTDINPLFREQKMQAIRGLNYEDGHKTFLFLKDRYWEKNTYFPPIYGGNNSSDLPNISIYYPSDHGIPIPGTLNGWAKRPGTSPNEPGVLLGAYNWVMEAMRLGNEREDLLISDVIRYVETADRLPPCYVRDRILSYAYLNWEDVQYIWGGSCLGKVLDKLVFSHVVTLPEMNEKIFFAGEHISQKHGWQQGSFQTAMVASNEIAKRIKAARS